MGIVHWMLGASALSAATGCGSILGLDAYDADPASGSGQPASSTSATGGAGGAASAGGGGANTSSTGGAGGAGGSVSASRVFVTNAALSGVFGGMPSAAINSADGTCQLIADGALPNPRTFVAWLTSSARPDMSVLMGGGPWYLVDMTGVADTSKRVANDYDDILNCTANCLDHAINVSETGAGMLIYEVWTGTTAAGMNVSAEDCDDWTLTSNMARAGSSDQTSNAWTHIGTKGCNEVAHLYCFELPL